MFCSICGITFRARRRHADTCSPKCRQAKHRHPELVKDYPKVNLFKCVPPSPTVDADGRSRRKDTKASTKGKLPKSGNQRRVPRPPKVA